MNKPFSPKPLLCSQCFDCQFGTRKVIWPLVWKPWKYHEIWQMSGKCREIDQQSGNCQGKNLVRKNCLLLTLQVFGQHQCLVLFSIIVLLSLLYFVIIHYTVSVKLHYMDTGYGHVVQHHQRTSSQQFCNLLYNKFTTNREKVATSRHLDMLRYWALALRCGKFVIQQVVEWLWACPLAVVYNMSVAGVHVVESGT